MSLAPDEQEELIQIEDRLRWSDPGLALKLEMFEHQAFRRTGPVRERLSPWRRRPWLLRLLIILPIVLLIGVVWAIAFTHHPAPAPARLHHCVSASHPASCRTGGQLPGLTPGRAPR